jgi:VanZ family protein
LAALAVLMTAVYGALDEWHQSFVPGRFPERADFYADVLGAAVAAAGVWTCSIILSSGHPRRGA